MYMTNQAGNYINSVCLEHHLKDQLLNHLTIRVSTPINDYSSSESTNGAPSSSCE